LTDKNLCGHLQELSSIHSSESLQFLQFSPYVPLGLANKSGTNHLLVFSGFQVKGGVKQRPHANARRTGWDSHLALGGLLMFCSCMAFPLLPSCRPRMPPGTVQVAGNLGHYWGPNGGLREMSLNICLGIEGALRDVIF
jgi:hypothetical protein